MLGHGPVGGLPVSGIPEVAAGAAAVQPQRLHLWRAATLVALGFFAADDTGAVNHQSLHAFRAAPVAAASGSTALGGIQPVFVEGAQDAVRSKHSALHLFRSVTPAAPAQNTPWFLWKKPTPLPDAEDDARRVDNSLLHEFRSVTQNNSLGLRVWAISDAVKWITEESYSIPKPVDLTPFRGVATVATQAGQSLYLWKQQARIDDPESDATRPNHTLLHRYRTTFQTVGQPWLHWVKPQARIDDEQYTVKTAPGLDAFRQIAIVAQPGQPWFMWPKAIADQTVEPNPVVIDHAGLMYAFRPHEALEPVIPPTTPSPHGFEIRGDQPDTRRRKQLPEVSRKPILQRIMEARAQAAIQQVIAKPAKKNARKRALEIEQKAADLVAAGGDEQEFFVLLDRWIAQTPVFVDSGEKIAQNVAEQLFMAQVALKVAAMQELEDERMIISLIQQGVI